ncbi:hypothetical protein, partial [Streptomyces sp. P17]|uniref:hypothetical protein n=1 Tax=Streptomyces sp. P17 TaxID=3074716 RepID=UPI0028F4372E
ASTRRADALALYRQSAPAWAANPDLVEKTYFFDAENAVGGGVYHWRAREAAQRWHGGDYPRLIRDRYGTAPRVEMFEAVLRIDAVT